MTVTIDLPPMFEREAPKLSAAQGKSLEQVARQALAEWMFEKLEEEEDARVALERSNAVQRGETLDRDWDDFAAELDAEDAAIAVPPENRA